MPHILKLFCMYLIVTSFTDCYEIDILFAFVCVCLVKCRLGMLANKLYMMHSIRRRILALALAYLTLVELLR